MSETIMEAVRPAPSDGRPFIQTRTGRRMWPLAPDVSMIALQDVAWGLSNQIRYAGHSPRYTVAQHAVLVSYHAEGSHLQGLHHDDSEAYLGDVPRPLKILPEFDGYREIENSLQSRCYEAFGISDEQSASVHVADRAVFAAEVRDLMQPWLGDCQMEEPVAERIVVWSHDEAYYRFIQRHVHLTGQGGGLCNAFSWSQHLRWWLKDLFRGTRLGRTTT